MSMRFRFGIPLVLPVLFAAGPALAQSSPPSFLEFESGPVRPLTLSADGTKLYACNIPDNRLEIYDVGSAGLRHTASVPVGMEPVAVALRTSSEAWVVNHLSDSISIVDLTTNPPIVKRTLLVGDEPRDIVFSANGRAFITTAHRGEQRVDPSLAGVPGAGDPQLTTPGVGRADVWVFDGSNPGGGPGGVPLRIMTLFGDTPRPLAVSGDTVYAGIFYSGNRTAVVPESSVCNDWVTTECNGADTVTVPGGPANGRMPGGLPFPRTNRPARTGEIASLGNVQAPETSLVVQQQPDGIFRDAAGRNWRNGIRFNLPDYDVFAIDAVSGTVARQFAGVGTTLFNMAVHPVNRNLYITNTDAKNLTRFEGPGITGGSTVQGNLAQSRITIIPGGTGTPVVRHLNSHINYSVRPAPAGTAAHSLSTPLGMVFSPDGATVYVAAYGSNKVGVLRTAELENGTFNPASASAGYINLPPVTNLPSRGPAGLALSPGGDRLYVLTRFDNAISVVNTATRAELHKVNMHNPEPTEVVRGRPFLYDAAATSSNGEASCASCHIFGEMDQLAWDLGNPDELVSSNPTTIRLVIAAGAAVNGGAANDQLHPMKGPMTTQTLKGLANHGHMHWRGDRVDGEFSGARNSTTGAVTLGARDTWEHTSFKNFIVATSGLNGRATNIAATDMEWFTQFALQLRLPPNPIRRLDNNLSGFHGQLAARYDTNGAVSTAGGAQAASPFRGQEYYFGRVNGRTDHLSDGVRFGGFGFTCNGCHTLEPQNGFFGGNGFASFDGVTQIIKIPHTRNAYQKVGMFGIPVRDGGAFRGDQVRSTGYLHDGAVDTLFHFFQAAVFGANGTSIGFQSQLQRRDVEAFMLAFDTDLAPVVGQQVTLTANVTGTSDPISQRLNLLIARAAAPFTSKILGGTVTECDLVAKTVAAGKVRGFVRRSDGLFHPDNNGPALSDNQLRALATPATPVTYTCAPPGSGQRMGVDRDLDSVLDGVDNCPSVANANQADSDGDGFGDVCQGSAPPDDGCGGNSTAASAMPLALLGLLGGLGGLGFWRRRREGREG